MKIVNIIFHPGHKSEGSFNGLNNWKDIIESNLPNGFSANYMLLWPSTMNFKNVNSLITDEDLTDKLYSVKACELFLEKGLVDETETLKDHPDMWKVKYSKEGVIKNVLDRYEKRSSKGVITLPVGGYDQSLAVVIPVSNSNGPWFINGLNKKFDKVVLLYDDKMPRFATAEPELRRYLLSQTKNNQPDISSCFKEENLPYSCSCLKVPKQNGTPEHYILERDR